MRHDRPELHVLERRTDEPTPEELEAQHMIELPEREAISVVNASVALPIATAGAAGLLNGS